MGAFATYAGFIYNDIFSKSLHLFDSGWDFSVNGTVGTFNGHTYPFGLDPGWHGASNALIFTNSYKMKMSIVIGVIHVSTWSLAFRKLKLMLQKMTFALCLQVPNHLKFRNQSDIWTNFVPQMLFLQSIFGYLVVCILYKWSVDWSRSPISPPSLLNMLINMFLSPGTIDPDEQLYAGQGTVQTTLLLIAALCVPWLLCAKPYLKWREMKRVHEQHERGYIGLSSDHDTRQTSLDETLEAEEEGDGRAIVEDMEGEHVGPFMLPGLIVPTEFYLSKESHDFGEMIVHQVIHTIEFCLGCISHTASYLRLWALSLAHAQLSEVLWTMTVEDLIPPEGITGLVALILMGAFWFSATIGILCIMEVGCGSQLDPDRRVIIR